MHILTVQVLLLCSSPSFVCLSLFLLSYFFPSSPPFSLTLSSLILSPIPLLFLPLPLFPHLPLSPPLPSLSLLSHHPSHSPLLPLPVVFIQQFEQLEQYVPRYLVSTLLWAFSGDSKMKSREQMGEFIRSVTTIPLPSAALPIIDYEVRSTFVMRPLNVRIFASEIVLCSCLAR